jgi:PRC-barrel domain
MLLRHRDIGPLLQPGRSAMANNDMDRVVPLGQLDDFKVAEGDPDVRGWEVLASDGRKIGEVDELLVDTSAMKVRYLDVDVDGGVMGDGLDRHVLIPIGYARLEQERDCVMVDGLAASDLGGLPAYDQGPLTRDFESSVRESFSRRRTTSPGMTGAGSGMLDTAGMDNTPGMGTGMGMTGTTTGAGLSDAEVLRADDHTRGAGLPDGEGMRAAGYDLDGTTAGGMRTGAHERDTGSMRTGLDADRGTTGGGLSAGSMSTGPWLGGGGGDRMSAGSTSDGPVLGGGGGDRASTGSAWGASSGSSPELGGTVRGDAGLAGSDDRLSTGMSAGAGGQGPVSGMGTDRGPQGDMSHRAGGHSGLAGSDYLHNADEDFYASDAFDDSRFYGARRGTGLGGGPRTDASGMRDVGGTNALSGGGMSASPGGTGAPMRAGGDPGGLSDSMGADRDEVRRLAQDASELLREDHRNRDVGGTGSR